MSCAHGHDGTPGQVPAEDKNPEPPAPPAEHEPQTPELLGKLIQELNEVRDERSQLFADRMAQPTSMNKPEKSNVVKTWERDNKDAELSEKEGSLMRQVRQLMDLLPSEQRPRTLGM